MTFNKLNAFTKKVSDFADQVTGNPSEIKAQFDAAPEELRTYFNNLVDALKSTSDTDSGAKNLGAKAISGLTGTDVQSLLEDLAKKTYQVSPNIINATLLNNWVVSGPGQAIYWKDADGIVHYYLAIKSGSTGANVTIMSFPSGYIPDREFVRDAYCEGSDGVAKRLIYHVTNNPAGELKILRDAGTANSLVIIEGSYKAVS
jgi:hypothetical protein